ncbi:MAG: hypothetical protein EOO40_07885, partial [Deltaproteobacteria bacterium]
MPPVIYVFCAADAGVSTALSVALTTATSSATIDVGDIGDPNLQGSFTNIQIVAAAASGFVVTGYP